MGSLANLWENLNTLGFVEATTEDFRCLFREIKDEAQELIEEGSELFTDGFVEMCLRNNEYYQTSAEKRADGRKMIETLKTISLDKRGIDSGSLPVMMVLDLEFRLIVDSLTEFEEAEIEVAMKENVTEKIKPVLNC
jgi:hypothetical protein